MSYPGTTIYQGKTFEDIAPSRVLSQFEDEAPDAKWRAMFAAKGARLDAFILACRELSNVFDTAHYGGFWLDLVGRIVGQPRMGATDARYRDYIAIRIALILSVSRDQANWTGTHNNILTIIRTFIGVDPAPVILYTSAPYEYFLSVEGIDTTEISALVLFLRSAMYAGVSAQLGVELTDGLIWDSVSVDVPRANVLGSATIGPSTPVYNHVIGI